MSPLLLIVLFFLFMWLLTPSKKVEPAIPFRVLVRYWRIGVKKLWRILHQSVGSANTLQLAVIPIFGSLSVALLMLGGLLSDYLYNSILQQSGIPKAKPLELILIGEPSLESYIFTLTWCVPMWLIMTYLIRRYDHNIRLSKT